MLKQLHEITLKDVILLDATKDARILKKLWFIPLWLCKKELETLGKQIFEAIGGSTMQDLEDKFDRIMSYNKLQILEALYKALEIEVKLRPQIMTYKILLQKEHKESGQLLKVTEEIKNITGIEIKEPGDLKIFYDHVQYKIDKHAEMFPLVDEGHIDEDHKEEVKLIKIIYSVFNIMSEPYNEHMRLITFIELKAMAEEKINQLKTNEDNGELTGNNPD